MKKTKQTAFRLDPDTWGWLEQEAQRTGKSTSVLIREGIELLKAEVKVLASLKAQFEASGVAYPAMKAQTVSGVKQVALKSFDVTQSNKCASDEYQTKKTLKKELRVFESF